MANLSTQTGILTVDLIDDLGVDTISFHDSLDEELYRVRLRRREPVSYGPGRPCHMHAKAWAGKVCVFVFASRLIEAGNTYMVSFDE